MSSETEHPAFYVNQTGRILAIKAAGGAALALILVSSSVWNRDSFAGNAIQAVGLCLVIAAVLGRLWATLYIGGRKNAHLVTAGPYSITRNPLYCFSILGAVGIGLLFGSLAVAMLLGGSVAVLLTAKARSEATLLGERFGESYASYAARVPLLWPRPSLYRDADAPSFEPSALRRALRDALLFLLAIPASVMVDYLKSMGLLPQLIALF
jgi:protein-S-isoprenylcysteine O-methyltransferase Ste14